MPLSPTDFYTSHLAGLHSQLLNHPIVHDYLSGVGIKISGKTLAPDDVLELDFGTFSILELAHLFSIFDKSRVHMQVEKEGSLDDAPAGIYLTIINKHVIENLHKNKLGVYQRTDSTRVDLVIQDMHIDHYFLKENQTPATLGTIAFALCAITAHLADMGRITLVAAGGRGSAPATSGFKSGPSSVSMHLCSRVKQRTPRSWTAARPFKMSSPGMRLGGWNMAPNA